MRYCLNIKGVNPHTFALSYQKNNQFSAKSKIFVLFSAKNTGAHEKSESRIFIRLLFYSVHLSVVYPVFISAGAYNFVLPEEKRNAPYSRKCYYYIQNSAHNTCTSAECPGYNVKSEQTDKSPVDSAYKQYKKSYLVKHCCVTVLPLNVMPVNKSTYAPLKYCYRRKAYYSCAKQTNTADKC